MPAPVSPGLTKIRLSQKCPIHAAIPPGNSLHLTTARGHCPRTYKALGGCFLIHMAYDPSNPNSIFHNQDRITITFCVLPWYSKYKGTSKHRDRGNSWINTQSDASHLACHQPPYLPRNQRGSKRWLLYRYKCLYQDINVHRTSLNKSSHKQQSLLGCHGSYCVCNRTIHLRDSCQSLSLNTIASQSQSQGRPGEEGRLRVIGTLSKWLGKKGKEEEKKENPQLITVC